MSKCLTKCRRNIMNLKAIFTKMALKKRSVAEFILRHYFPSFPQNEFIKILPYIIFNSLAYPYFIFPRGHNKIIEPSLLPGGRRHFHRKLIYPTLVKCLAVFRLNTDL